LTQRPSGRLDSHIGAMPTFRPHRSRSQSIDVGYRGFMIKWRTGMKRLLALTVLAAFACAGQTADQPHGTLAAETENRVKALSGKFSQLLSPTPEEQQLLAACKVNCSTAQAQGELPRTTAERLAAMDAIISQIHIAVDHYITHIVNPRTLDSDRIGIESNLKQILSSAGDMPPVTFTSASAVGYTLIVVYSLHKGEMMGPGATSVTVRAYRAKGNHVEVVDTTGGDLDGYGRVSAKELRSPTRDEAWFLVSGYMTGANGPNVRMRVYACNSGKFRTMWMPANVWGEFTAQVTDAGFTVEGPYYREDEKRRETYALAPDGLYLVRSNN
jgi:hypothetical protein